MAFNFILLLCVAPLALAGPWGYGPSDFLKMLMAKEHLRRDIHSLHDGHDILDRYDGHDIHNLHDRHDIRSLHDGHDILDRYDGHDIVDRHDGHDILGRYDGRDILNLHGRHDIHSLHDGHNILDRYDRHDLLDRHDGHDIFNLHSRHDILNGHDGHDILDRHDVHDILDRYDGRDFHDVHDAHYGVSPWWKAHGYGSMHHLADWIHYKQDKHFREMSEFAEFQRRQKNERMAELLHFYKDEEDKHNKMEQFENWLHYHREQEKMVEEMKGMATYIEIHQKMNKEKEFGDVMKSFIQRKNEYVFGAVFQLMKFCRCKNTIEGMQRFFHGDDFSSVIDDHDNYDHLFHLLHGEDHFHPMFGMVPHPQNVMEAKRLFLKGLVHTLCSSAKSYVMHVNALALHHYGSFGELHIVEGMNNGMNVGPTDPTLVNFNDNLGRNDGTQTRQNPY